jgi:ABC-type multidrug transport system ATPase subunit
MSQIILETSLLSKRYGRVHAVDDLNLRIEKGMVFGLLGPNGSGKTTTLGMLLGVTSITSGGFTWFEDKPDHQVRKKIGAILERPVFYPGYTAVQNLQVVERIKDLDGKNRNEVLKMVGLYDRRNDPFDEYSLGMKQRLAIACAMLCDPEVLILDEPTNGLDPKGISEIREMILQIAGMGKTIILASHLLAEVQKVCTDFCVLREGKLIHTGKVNASLGDAEIIEVDALNRAKLLETLQNWGKTKSIKSDDTVPVLTAESGTTAEELNAYLITHGITVNHLVKRSQSLEEQFLEILNQNP